MLLDIKYRNFYDVPRIFLAKYQEHQLLFDCEFDESIDEYPDTYVVSSLPHTLDAELIGSWEDLPLRAIKRLGVVGVKDVGFDPTRRKYIESDVLDNLMSALAIGSGRPEGTP